MVALSTGEMLSLALIARDKLNDIQIALTEVQSLTNISAEEDPSINCVIQQLDIIYISANDVIIYINGDEHTAGAGMGVLGGEHYNNLMGLLEALINNASNININGIQISGEHSLRAAKALLQAFDASQALLPDSRIATKQAELKAVIHSATCSLQEPATPIENIEALNAYMRDEYTRISALTSLNERVTLYALLNKDITERFQSLTQNPAWHAYIPNAVYCFFKKDNQTEKDTYLALRKQITDQLEIDTLLIIEQFDALTSAFREKIDNLGKRGHTEAVKIADGLLYDLEDAKTEFEASSDLPEFKERIHDALNTFEGHDAFENNRDSEWGFLIQIFIDLVRLIFGPYTTDTTQKFEVYTEGLKHLGEEAPEAPSPSV
jgi:hypothetical protein